MASSKDRIEFTKHLGMLITFAFKNKNYIYGNYWFRSAEEQARLLRAGKSKTANSRHQLGLAIDFVMFDAAGQPVWDSKKYEPLGIYWESLHPQNLWGGRFGDPDGRQGPRVGWDGGHFERKP